MNACAAGEWRRPARHASVMSRRNAGAMSLAMATSAPAWVAAGAGDQEIADKLGVSARTVHAHLRAIFEILGVENRLAAVLAACRHFTQQLAYEGD